MSKRRNRIMSMGYVERLRCDESSPQPGLRLAPVLREVRGQGGLDSQREASVARVPGKRRGVVVASEVLGNPRLEGRPSRPAKRATTPIREG